MNIAANSQQRIQTTGHGDKAHDVQIHARWQTIGAEHGQSDHPVVPARDQRLVWLLDTTEQLAIVSSEWLLDRQLLTSDDMQTRTLEWLKRQITARALPNTTLVCAGRGREVYGKDAIIEIWTEPFTINETQEYFQVLADDLGHSAKGGTPHIARSYERFAKTIGYLATDADRAKVVWLYTGGVPVRLALYAQLVAEGRTIPEELQWSWKDATSRVQTETPEETTAQLELTQWQIEEYFINMLFDPRNAADLGYRILLALVRARRGLTAEQLHFILDNTESLQPKQWEASVNTRRIRQIDDQLKQMEGLFLVKARPAWWRLGESAETGPLPGAERRGLQDEIYRLFVEHMSPHRPTPAPGSRLARIWAAQQPADLERYEQNRQDEQHARQTLYGQLRQWALYQRDKLYQQRREYQDNDEHALRLFNPADARRVAFTPLGERERARRLAIREAIHELDLEYMYYSLLLDPEKGFNEDYYELSNRQLWAAEDEGYDILIQAEMWRVLHDEDALRFVDFVPRQSIFERHETSLLVLRRAAQQDDAARWIRRFFFRKEYKRAVAFADSIEAAVEPLQFGTQQARNDWASWNHTFARGQRLCWRQYAMVTTASDVRKAVDDLASMVADLELLAHKTLFEVAIPASRSLTGQDEQGFKGVPGSDPRQPIRHHPGYRMLRRVISIGYNILGYGSVNLGLFRQSLKYYGAALY